MTQINPIYPYFDDALKYQWQKLIELRERMNSFAPRSINEIAEVYSDKNIEESIQQGVMKFPLPEDFLQDQIQFA